MKRTYRIFAIFAGLSAWVLTLRNGLEIPLSFIGEQDVSIALLYIGTPAALGTGLLRMGLIKLSNENSPMTSIALQQNKRKKLWPWPQLLSFILLPAGYL